MLHQGKEDISSAQEFLSLSLAAHHQNTQENCSHVFPSHQGFSPTPALAHRQPAWMLLPGPGPPIAMESLQVKESLFLFIRKRVLVRGSTKVFSNAHSVPKGTRLPRPCAAGPLEPQACPCGGSRGGICWVGKRLPRALSPCPWSNLQGVQSSRSWLGRGSSRGRGVGSAVRGQRLHATQVAFQYYLSSSMIHFY